LFLFLQLVSTLELGRQLAGAQILPNMRETMLELAESIRDVGLIRDRYIAPHRIRARRDTRHLAQRAAAGFEQGSLPELIDQRCGQRCRDHLRQVADPGAELVVLLCGQMSNARAEFLHPLEKFAAQPAVDVLPGEGCDEPGRAFE
jgi:hypothetical protein